MVIRLFPQQSTFPEIVDLSPGNRKGILDRDLGMLLAPLTRSRVTDRDVLVRRHRQQDMDLKPGAVAMMIARSDHRDPA